MDSQQKKFTYLEAGSYNDAINGDKNIDDMVEATKKNQEKDKAGKLTRISSTNLSDSYK